MYEQMYGRVIEGNVENEEEMVNEVEEYVSDFGDGWKEVIETDGKGGDECIGGCV